MITKDYRDNRDRLPNEALAAHRGKWAAFSPDGCRIIASATTIESLETQLAAIGVDGQNVVFEWVAGPDDDDCRLGAEEWR
jgi:hypothetical protein